VLAPNPADRAARFVSAALLELQSGVYGEGDREIPMERMRRRFNIARRWKLALAILLGIAASGLAVAGLSGGTASEHAGSHDGRPAVLANRKVSSRSATRKSHTRHAARRLRGVRRRPHPSIQSHGSLPTLVGVGNVGGCIDGSASGLPILRTYHASVLRVVVQTPYGQNGQALPCVRAARAAGAKLNLAIGYNNLWSTSRIVAYFRHVLALYGPYAWAISIGNEQELSAGKGASATPSGYAAVWRAVEPVVARMAPQAIRVAGEVSPWGFSFLRQAYASGLPGAQAIAVHPYAASFGFKLGAVLAWVHTTHLPLWATEGLTGPAAWNKPDLHPVPESQLAGVTLASAWVRQ
jgi:hypothetical protein